MSPANGVISCYEKGDPKVPSENTLLRGVYFASSKIIDDTQP